MEEEQEKAELGKAEQVIHSKFENEVNTIYCTIFDRYQKEADEKLDLHEKMIE